MFRIDDATAKTSLPTPEAAGTEGYFGEGNPGSGDPATNVRASWLNMIQEEICSILSAAGIARSKTSYNQLLTALRSSGVFATPALFDNSTKPATTAFVQSALGNLRGMTAYSATSQQLVAADMGKFVYSTSAANATFTLPDATTVPAGASVYLYNSSSSGGTLTVVTPNGVFSGPGNSGGGTSSLSFSPGVGNQFISSGSVWFAIGAGGVGSIGPTGYQKLPSGFIEQWGTATTSASADTIFTFPIAFPTAVIGVWYSIGNSGASFANGYGATLSSVKVNNWTTAGARAAGGVAVRAIGY